MRRSVPLRDIVMPRKKSVEEQFRQEREAGWDSTNASYSLSQYNSLTDRVRVLPAKRSAVALSGLFACPLQLDSHI